MQKLTQISEDALLLSPGDPAGKRVAALLEEFAREAGLSEPLRETATAAAKLAKKIATKKATDKDLSDLLALLSALETSEQDSTSAVTSDLVAEYLGTQGSVLEDFEESALKLSHGGDEVLRALRRQVHTWKGELGIIGAEGLAKSLHKIEDALESVAPEQYSNVTDALLDLKDLMSNAFAALQNGATATLNPDPILQRMTAPEIPAEVAPEVPVKVVQAAPSFPNMDGDYFLIPDGVDVELVGEFLTESEEHFTIVESGMMSIESDPGDAESVNSVFRAFHTVKGVASFVGVSYITELAHKSENLLDRVRKGTLQPSGPFVDVVFESLDLLRRLIQDLPNAVAQGRKQIPPNYASLMHRLEHPELWQTQDDSADQTSPEESEEDSTRLAAAPDTAQRNEGAATSVATTTDATVKVNMSRLDNLINMVGELVIAQAMVSQDPAIAKGADRKLVQNVAQLAKITRSLQELSLSMRMVSVRATFQKMARLVRDVARKANKLVEFEMAGEETELDRNMVEAIADPLVHMVRNAVDHGIEAPAERDKSGKPKTGTVKLSAAHEGGSVVITLRDDGKGLNRDRIISKAIEKGLIDPAAQLTDREIYNLIFLPGFSTAEKITDISGRGVGMDVVRTNIEKLRGSVEIDSTPGAGSIFRIRLPLTLAIIDGMVVRVGSQRFIIPTIAITESIRPQPQDIITVHGRGEMVKLRGQLIPICRIHSAYDIADAGVVPHKSILLVAEAKTSRIAIMADALLGQHQVVIKSLGKLFDGMEGVAGCAILGDGRISLILDVDGVMRTCQNSFGIPDYSEEMVAS